MRTRRALILGAAGGVLLGGAVLAWRGRSNDPLLPLPLGDMGWELTDQRGALVRPSDWIGRPALVFFGFTWCPDVCPTTLSDISLWLEDLGPDADRLTLALISVDPGRDTPQALADYLTSFDPRITGLTGPQAQIDRALQDFRARAERVGAGDDYTMNHTSGVFLFHADGRFGGIIDYHEDRRFALPKIRRVLG